MAHGNPRMEYCESCQMLGLIPRFSESECPSCGEESVQINRDRAKKLLALSVFESLNLGFTWKEVIEEI